MDETDQGLPKLTGHLGDADKTAVDYRIESANPIAGALLPISGPTEFPVFDVAMAVTLASKTVTPPFGQETRVVDVPTGEIVFG